MSMKEILNVINSIFQPDEDSGAGKFVCDAQESGYKNILDAISKTGTYVPKEEQAKAGEYVPVVSDGHRRCDELGALGIRAVVATSSENGKLYLSIKAEDWEKYQSLQSSSSEVYVAYDDSRGGYSPTASGGAEIATDPANNNTPFYPPND